MALFTQQEMDLLSAFSEAFEHGSFKVPFPTKGIAMQYRQKCYALRKKVLGKIEKGVLAETYKDAMQEVLIQLQQETPGQDSWALIFNRTDNTAGAAALKAALGAKARDFNKLAEEEMQGSFAARLAAEGLGGSGVEVQASPGPAEARPSNPYFTRLDR